MKLENPFIGILLGALFFTGLLTMFISMGESYGADTSDLSRLRSRDNTTSLMEGLNKINDTSTELQNTLTDFRNTTLTDTGSLFSFPKVAWKVGTSMYDSVKLTNSIMTTIGTIMGIDGVIIATLFVILLVVFAISLLMIMLGRVY